MLEVKWKDTPPTSPYPCGQGFNPCYVGSKMERTPEYISLKNQVRFNPCYVGSKMESTTAFLELIY